MVRHGQWPDSIVAAKRLDADGVLPVVEAQNWTPDMVGRFLLLTEAQRLLDCRGEFRVENIVSLIRWEIKAVEAAFESVPPSSKKLSD